MEQTGVALTIRDPDEMVRIDCAGRRAYILLFVVLAVGLSGCRAPATLPTKPSEVSGAITPAAAVAATLASLVQEDATASPFAAPTETATPDQDPSPHPSETPEGAGEDDSSAGGGEATSAGTPTDTPLPTSAPSPSTVPVTDTPSPSRIPATASPRPVWETPTEEPESSTSSGTAGVVMDARIVYHNGFSEGTVGIYQPGAMPWLDLLVQLGGTWYGPEREPDDGISASPLPEGYQWQTSGSFGALPNGEAWWNESGTAGVARLIGPGGAVILELPIQIVFRSGGGGGSDSGPAPTPT